jgi:hypothetical protein
MGARRFAHGPNTESQAAQRVAAAGLSETLGYVDGRGGRVVGKRAAGSGGGEPSRHFRCNAHEGDGGGDFGSVRNSKPSAIEDAAADAGARLRLFLRVVASVLVRGCLAPGLRLGELAVVLALRNRARLQDDHRYPQREQERPKPQRPDTAHVHTLSSRGRQRQLPGGPSDEKGVQKPSRFRLQKPLAASAIRTYTSRLSQKRII